MAKPVDPSKVDSPKAPESQAQSPFPSQAHFIGHGKVVHIHAGLDLIGSKQSISHRDAQIEIWDYGVRILSKKTKRVIVIWSGNIRGAELL